MAAKHTFYMRTEKTFRYMYFRILSSRYLTLELEFAMALQKTNKQKNYEVLSPIALAQMWLKGWQREDM